jgi:hypothetical protein
MHMHMWKSTTAYLDLYYDIMSLLALQCIAFTYVHTCKFYFRQCTSLWVRRIIILQYIEETRNSDGKEVGEERRRARTCDRVERKVSEGKHKVAAGWRKGSSGVP